MDFCKITIYYSKHLTSVIGFLRNPFLNPTCIRDLLGGFAVSTPDLPRKKLFYKNL